jgi:hypothetical protein
VTLDGIEEEFTRGIRYLLGCGWEFPEGVRC